MRRIAFTILVIVAVFLTAAPPRGLGAPESDAAPQPGRLPVKRVVLYKNGVGYFEHTAKVRGNLELNIDFTTSQLNDVLNSLTVVDLGEGRIAGVRFNSIAELSERLKTLRLPLGAETSRTDYLNALRGTLVQVSGGGASAEGRVLSVDTRKVVNAKGDQLTEVTELSLITANGELRTFEVGPATAVRVADPDLSGEVSRYLNLIGSAKAMDVRRMTISAAGEGEREVFVSYISEVPVWKSTYRILLPEKPDEKPLIQGWAIVDNTVGEDWKDVRLSLVAGAPQSFIQQISQPYYVHRPVVAMPESMTLTPQTHEAAEMGTLGGLAVAPPPPPPPPPSAGPGVGGGVGGGVYSVGSGLQGVVTDPSGAVIPNVKVTLTNPATGAVETTRTDSLGHYRFGKVPARGSTLAFESPGFQTVRFSNVHGGRTINGTLPVGTVSQMVEVNAATEGVAEPAGLVSARDKLSEAMEAAGSEAEGKEISQLFEYDLKQNVTIEKNQSALVPIVQARIDAEKVTLWNADSAAALRALWITNSSGETLDGGSFNVLESNAFAGQGLLDALEPGERRLLSYAGDPAVQVKVVDGVSDKPISTIVINKGVMFTTNERREIKTYNVSNSDVTAREVVIEHPARGGWNLADNLKPEESSASFYRFKLKVDPKASAQLTVEEYQPQTSEFILTNLTSDYVEVLTKQQRVTPAMEQIFRRVLDQKSVIAGLSEQIQVRQQEIDAIGTDQARIRENMKALKGSVEERALTQRYAHQLNDQEDRLTALRSQVDDLSKKRQQAQDQLDAILNEITLNVTF